MRPGCRDESHRADCRGTRGRYTAAYTAMRCRLPLRACPAQVDPADKRHEEVDMGMEMDMMEVDAGLSTSN